MKLRRPSKKGIVIIALCWGIVLAIGGVINGNQALLAPDPGVLKQTVLQEKIGIHALNCWIANQRSDFMILEFAESNQCSTRFAGLHAYSCFHEKVLQNKKWVRNAFRKFDKQLIVFGSVSEKSLEAASILKRQGYTVRMLDNGDVTNTPLSAVQTQAPVFSYQSVQPALFAPVASPVSLSIDSEDAPEEEEGC